MTSSRLSRTSPTGVALAFRWKGRDRIVVPNRWATVAMLVTLPLLAAWSLGSGFYVLFHDQLLASLMSRQADMQYAYEDRIAALRSQLDRETSRGMIDHATLETTVRDLAARGRQLEAHAETMAALVTQGLKSPTLTVSRRTGAPVRFPRLEPAAVDNPLLAPSAVLPSDVRAYAPAPAAPAPASAPDLRLGAPDGDKRADLSRDDLAPAAIAARFAKIDASQAAVVAGLREPTLRAIARMRTALADTGLSQSHLPGRIPHEDVGGPFVPLPASAMSFDDGVALLRDAIRQQAKLDAMVDKVPLRKPLEGPLEISSTFGARLDPFYGRPAMHTGVDLKESYGDAVAATASGTVTIAGPDGGYGNMVEIDHGNGLATRYAHLSAINVVPHQVVSLGTIVGRVGSTGRSTGPHLHYETRIDGEAVDPTRFLRAGAALTRG